MPLKPFTRTIDFQQLCTEIAEHLAELDGDDLADLANKVLSDRVTYEGDSVFTVEDADAAAFKNGNLLDGKSPSEWINDNAKKG